jgi:hypothetical protein
LLQRNVPPGDPTIWSSAEERELLEGHGTPHKLCSYPKMNDVETVLLDRSTGLGVLPILVTVCWKQMPAIAN